MKDALEKILVKMEGWKEQGNVPEMDLYITINYIRYVLDGSELGTSKM